MTDNYEFQLSFEELLWLAKAFQFKSLHVAQNLSAKFAPYQIKEALQRAQKSLELRGYIQSSNRQNWQVDRLPGAIIHWIGTAHRRVDAQIIARKGDIQKASVFTETGMNMIMLDEDKVCRFLLFPDKIGLVKALLDWMSVPILSSARLKNGSSSFLLQQPEATIPAAWHNKKIAELILRRGGSGSGQVKATLKWMNTLQQVAALSSLRFEMDTPIEEAGCVLCSDKQNVWLGSEVIKSQEMLTLSPTSGKDLMENLVSFL